MARERFVLLGVARARAEWFRRIGQWSTSAVIPAEFVRCISLAEVRARLDGGRRFSAVLLDGALPGVDRDLLAAARDAGVPVIVVDDGSGRAWVDLGASAVLADPFDRESLLEALAAHAEMVGVAAVDHDAGRRADTDPRHGDLVAVTGPGGTGASTAAIALAQGLAAGDHGTVLLADLARNADQAMLHDSRAVVPGVQELVEAHRAGIPSAAAIHDQTFAVDGRGYRLLLGLRRPRHWVTIRAQALDATLDALQRSFDVVVADIDPDVEGEADTGSLDVEDRHLLSRATAIRASAVVVVGAPGMKGLHSLVRVLLDLVALGVPAERLLPVVMGAPRSPRARADITTSLGALARASLSTAADRLAAPIFLPTRRVDRALRDGVPLPAPLPGLLAAAVAAVRSRAGLRALPGANGHKGTLITPGDLPLFTSQEP